MSKENLFYLEVARCKRCGGILVSETSKKRGYGASCYKKEMINKKNKVVDSQQRTIFDYLK